MAQFKTLLAVSIAAGALAVAAAQAQTNVHDPKPSAAVAAAVADAGRPDADKTRDDNRKPAAVVAVSGLKAGDSVVELGSGGGYYTRILAKTVGADPLDIQSTFVGAICRWQAATPAGLIDITRFWFEQGSLNNERKIADGLKYKIETRTIQGVNSIVMRPDDANGACGVASDAGGSLLPVCTVFLPTASRDKPAA